MSSAENTTALTSIVKDKLAKCLCNDWKQFALKTKVFKYAEIESIDTDEQTTYNKIYKMLTQWERQSPSKVTSDEIISILSELHRNDILLDMFGYTPAHIQRDNASSQNIEKNYNCTEPTVRDLKQIHIEKLSSYLDSYDNVYVENWRQLGFAIFTDNQDVKDYVSSLELCYCGGGSPANRFFKALFTRYPEYTVKEFIKLAETHRRKDISLYLSKIDCSVEMEFRDLPHENVSKIADKLDNSNKGVSNWKIFAEEIGFGHEDIQMFGVALKENNQYSPTESLMERIRREYPSLTLPNLKKIVSGMGREDVAGYLDLVVKDIVASRQT